MRTAIILFLMLVTGVNAGEQASSANISTREQAVNIITGNINELLEIPINQISDTSVFVIKPDVQFKVVQEYNTQTHKFDSPKILFWPKSSGTFYLFATSGTNANVVEINISGPKSPFEAMVITWLPADKSLAKQLGQIYVDASKKGPDAQTMLDYVAAQVVNIKGIEAWIPFSDSLAAYFESQSNPNVSQILGDVGNVLLAQ